MPIYDICRQKVRGGDTLSVLPEGEQLRRAVKWISDMRLEDSEVSQAKLIAEACLKFDLLLRMRNFL
jgi:hypothetical protein